jgi:hypothetical protein
MGLSQWFRLFFLSLTVFLAVFLLIDLKEHPGDGFIGPLILILILLLAGSYKEEWIFDRQQKTVESRFGLIFLYQRKVIALEEIEAFLISEFIKGHQFMVEPEKRRFFQIAFSKFSLVTKEGMVKDIEIIKSRFKKELEKKGEQIAEFCSKNLNKK